MRTDVDTRTTSRSNDLATTSGSGRTLSIIGFVCAAVSLFFVPILFGPAAIVLGIVGYRKGDRLGLWAAIVGAVCLVAGMVIGAMVVNNVRNG